jgi:uncharacterized protein (DUF433 family)
MARRSFLAHLTALPFLSMSAWSQSATRKPLNIMMKSAWGSDDPTKAAFPFLHGLALSEAGHTVRIFLLGEAVGVMRKAVAGAIVPVGWPPLVETLNKVVARRIPIYACGACCRARGVTEADLTQWGERITVDPAQMGGVPCVRHLRIPVATVLRLLARGVSEREIVTEYPDLQAEDICACLRFAASTVAERELPPPRSS